MEKAQSNKSNSSNNINEIFHSLQNDFQKIQVSLEEKTKTNKKLYEDFTNLFFYLDKESELVSKLKKEKMIYEETFQELINEKDNFNKNMLSLNYARNEYLKHLDFLTKQNMVLNDQIKEEEKEIALLEQEKKNLKEKNKEITIINNKKASQIKINTNEINYFQEQLDISNNNINQLIENINELDNRYQKLKEQYEQISEDKNNLEKKKFNNDRIYQELMDNIKQKEIDINKNIEKLDKLSLEKEELFNYNTNINNDLERYQNHVYELANQNEKLMKEIEKFKNIEKMINEHIRYRKNKEIQLNQELNIMEKTIGSKLKNYLDNPNQPDNEIKNINDNNIDINKDINNQNKNDYQNEKDINDFNNVQDNKLNSYQNYDFNFNNNLIEQNNQEMNNNEENCNDYSGFQNELELEQNYE